MSQALTIVHTRQEASDPRKVARSADQVGATTTATTAAPGDSSTAIATTAFVTTAITAAGAGYQPLNAALTTISGQANTTFGLGLLTAADAAALRGTLSVYSIAQTNSAITTALAPYLLSTTAASTYQPLDSDLTAIALLVTATYGRSLLTIASATALMNSLSASDLTTGTLPAGRMPALTGDVSTTAGSVATTIGANKVTLAQMATVATATFLGRTTAATGNVEALTVAQAKSLLNLTGTNSGDQTITLTGDVTGSGTGSFAATIGANKVTLAQMATVATATFLGRTTAATGNVEALTTAQAKTLLNLTGTNSGDQTITLTGDVTGSGTGSFAATLATAQPAVHTWALAQTFTVAPVFTDQANSRAALGLGTAATVNTGASGATIPLLSVSNTWSAAQVMPAITLNAAAGVSRPLTWQTSSSPRWQFTATTTAESGANAGSNLNMNAYDDSGTLLGMAFAITRSTQVVAFVQSPTVPTPTAGDNTTKAATTAFVTTAVAAGKVSATVSTTDATVTSLLLLAIAASTTVVLEAIVVARRAGGVSGTAEDGAAYKILAAVKNVAGVATLIGTPSVTIIGEDVAAYDCLVNANSGNLRIRVTGVATTNIDWSLEGKTTIVT